MSKKIITYKNIDYITIAEKMKMSCYGCDMKDIKYTESCCYGENNVNDKCKNIIWKELSLSDLLKEV